MMHRHNLGRVARVVAPLALVAGTGVAFAGATTTSVQAQPDKPGSPGDVSIQSCSHSSSNKDADYGYVDADWLRYRTGPHDSCAALGQAKDGTKIYYHCYVRNSAGNTWTHGRIAGTNQQGWFYDGYLSDGGSGRYC